MFRSTISSERSTIRQSTNSENPRYNAVMFGDLPDDDSWMNPLEREAWGPVFEARERQQAAQISDEDEAESPQTLRSPANIPSPGGNDMSRTISFRSQVSQVPDTNGQEQEQGATEVSANFTGLGSSTHDKVSVEVSEIQDIEMAEAPSAEIPQLDATTDTYSRMTQEADADDNDELNQGPPKRIRTARDSPHPFVGNRRLSGLAIPREQGSAVHHHTCDRAEQAMAAIMGRPIPSFEGNQGYLLADDPDEAESEAESDTDPGTDPETEWEDADNADPSYSPGRLGKIVRVELGDILVGTDNATLVGSTQTQPDSNTLLYPMDEVASREEARRLEEEMRRLQNIYPMDEVASREARRLEQERNDEEFARQLQQQDNGNAPRSQNRKAAVEHNGNKNLAGSSTTKKAPSQKKQSETKASCNSEGEEESFDDNDDDDLDSDFTTKPKASARKTPQKRQSGAASTKTGRGKSSGKGKGKGNGKATMKGTQKQTSEEKEPSLDVPVPANNRTIKLKIPSRRSLDNGQSHQRPKIIAQTLTGMAGGSLPGGGVQAQNIDICPSTGRNLAVLTSDDSPPNREAATWATPPDLLFDDGSGQPKSGILAPDAKRKRKSTKKD